MATPGPAPPLPPAPDDDELVELVELDELDDELVELDELEELDDELVELDDEDELSPLELDDEPELLDELEALDPVEGSELHAPSKTNALTRAERRIFNRLSFMKCTKNQAFSAMDITHPRTSRDFFLAAHVPICEGPAMNLLSRTIPLAFTMALFACGGSTPPPNDAQKNSDSEAAPPGTGSSSEATEEERKSFMTECTETPELKDFCSCSWDSVTKTTTAEERKDVENPKMKKALAALPDQCGNKLPKEAIKGNFIKACAKSPSMAPFCECSFHFLDGKGLLTSGPEGVAKVEGEMKAACSKELYELARGAFMQGCGGKQPEAVCKCTFGALEKKYGKDKLQSFLETGGDDAKNAVKAAGATCGAK